MTSVKNGCVLYKRQRQKEDKSSVFTKLHFGNVAINPSIASNFIRAFNEEYRRHKTENDDRCRPTVSETYNFSFGLGR